MPCFTIPPVPSIVPANVLFPLPPNVREFPPRAILVPATPVSPPIDCDQLAPLISRTAPAFARSTLPVLASAPPLTIISLPALIVVPPV
ncbi:hypothetical protein F9K85_12805 [Brucella tritici]|uniref:Uncharacterized protein n=1 Tax=Brucella tritici TaxID=94626 RepID=A0A6L3YVT4_9HYPH|nr:hypothetical protein F9K85_12805 [Brucella tritici]KAB2688501.1 hypothetical protein F9L08_05265 [Brucella tritici]